MEIQKCEIKSFSVIGRLGSTEDGKDFIQNLWQEANDNVDEISYLAKKDENGNIFGVWGLMSDLLGRFEPWEDNYSKGLYLAGIEVKEDSAPPKGWVKWTVPSYEYIYTVNDKADTFRRVLAYMEKNQLNLVGSVHERHCPETKKDYLFFPIKRI